MGKVLLQRQGSGRPERCVVIRPELRDSDIERDAQVLPREDLTLYWRLNATVAPDVTDSERLTRATWTQTVRACLAPDVATVVVPEPLWVRYWPKAVATVLVARALRGLTGRTRFHVGLYAIDNLEPRERFTVPALDDHRGLNRFVSRVMRPMFRYSIAMSVDRIAFGTTDAAQNYRDGGMLPGTGSLATMVIPEQHGPCVACFGPAGDVRTDAERERRVLFLGELAERKGVDTLLDAWASSQLRSDGWTLTLCGSGDLSVLSRDRSARDPSIELRQPTRAEVHELLRTSAAVVLPSRRVRRWQEQVGLSMLEGESHGCALIVSSDSGAAQDLARRARARVVTAGDVPDLAAALDALPEAPRATPSGSDTNHAVRAFLVGKSLVPPGPRSV